MFAIINNIGIKVKSRCEYKELFDKRRCDKGFIRNPGSCECECDKSWHVRECWDYENCKCSKKLVGKLVEKYNEEIDWNEMIYNAILNDYGNVCDSFTIYNGLFVIAFLITIGISSIFMFFIGI